MIFEKVLLTLLAFGLFTFCATSPSPPSLDRLDGRLPWEMILKVSESLTSQDVESWIQSSTRLQNDRLEDLMLYHMIHRKEILFDPWENEADHQLGQRYPLAYKKYLAFKYPMDLTLDPSCMFEKFKTAIVQGRFELVEHAIKAGIDPSGGDNWAIRFASELGHLRIVELLLQDSRVNATARDNYAIIEASRGGHLDVVARLIQHGVASMPIDGAVKMACLNGHLEILDMLILLLREKGDNEKALMDDSLLLVASRNGHLSIMERLLELPGLDPSCQNNYPLIIASTNGHHKIVDRLLRDARVDPSDRNNQAVSLACDNGYHLVVDRLLQDERVDPCVNDHEAIISACNRGDYLVFEILEQHYKRNEMSLPPELQ